jgi:hypothetical protein
VSNIKKLILATLRGIGIEVSIEKIDDGVVRRHESAVQIEIAQLGARVDQATGIADRALGECATLRSILDGCIAAFSDGPPATRDTLVDRVRTLNDTATALQVSLVERVEEIRELRAEHAGQAGLDSGGANRVLDQVRLALMAAIVEIVEHNASGSHLTPKDTIEGWLRVANPTERQDGAAGSGSVESR